MKEKRKLLIICMIFACKMALGQFSNSMVGMIDGNYNKYIPTPFYIDKVPQLKKIVPPYFSTTQLGFFCRQEWKFESATKLPLKFRLGTVQYCDWMEGKKAAGILPSTH